jgi:hypothetical protein
VPHASLKLKPGVDQNETPALNEAGISQTNLIRFIPDRNGIGLIQKLGGWTKFYPTPLEAITRALWAWEDTNSIAHLAYGTQDISGSYITRLGCITNGTAKNITPRSLTSNVPPKASTKAGSALVTLTDDSVSGITKYDSVFITTHISVGGVVLFGQYACDPNDFLALNIYTVLATDVLGNAVPATSTSSDAVLAYFKTKQGNATVTVTLPNHGYSVGSTYPVLIRTTYGGITFYGNYIVQSVIDTDNFTINGANQATSQVPTEGYINNGDANFIYNFGSGYNLIGGGYGTGLYSLGTYGYGFEITPSTGNEIEAVDWTLDNWGQILISCPISTSSFSFTITRATTTTAGYGFGYYGFGVYGYGEQIGTIKYTPSYLIPIGQVITISGLDPAGWNGTYTVIPAVEFYGSIIGGSFEGSISGTTLTITNMYSTEYIIPGMIIGGDGLTVGTTIVSGFGNVWTVNLEQNTSLVLIQILDSPVLQVNSTVYGTLQIGDVVSGGDFSTVTTVTDGTAPIWLLSQPQATNGYGCYGFGGYGSGYYGTGASNTKYSAIRAGETTVATQEVASSNQLNVYNAQGSYNGWNFAWGWNEINGNTCSYNFPLGAEVFSQGYADIVLVLVVGTYQEPAYGPIPSGFTITYGNCTGTASVITVQQQPGGQFPVYQTIMTIPLNGYNPASGTTLTISAQQPNNIVQNLISSCDPTSNPDLPIPGMYILVVTNASATLASHTPVDGTFTGSAPFDPPQATVTPPFGGMSFGLMFFTQTGGGCQWGGLSPPTPSLQWITSTGYHSEGVSLAGYSLSPSQDYIFKASQGEPNTGTFGAVATLTPAGVSTGTLSLSQTPYQPIYQWDPTSNNLYATVIPNAPTVNDGAFVAMPQRQIIAWGSTETGIQDPLLVRWCDVNNFNVWAATVANQAGSYRLPRGSRIVGAIQGPQQGLIWTDVGVWSMQYIGPPYVYSFNEIGTGCGLIGRKAAASINGAVYWMGRSQFFSLTSSGVQPVACPVWDVVFQDIDLNNVQKIRAAVNSLFGEIAWYYPVTTDGGEVTKYIKYNVFLNVWDFGTLSRSAWLDQSILGNPIGADPSSLLLYQHETSNDADGLPLPASFTTGYFMMDESDHKIFVDEVWPDMKWGFYGSPQTAVVNMYFNATDFAGTTPTTYGPYPINVNTTWFNPRFRGRLTSITLSNPTDSSGLGTFWRIGNIRYRVQQDGKY